MTRAEQQAYEVLLQEAEQKAEFWKQVAMNAIVSIDCIETCLSIERHDLALQETAKAIRDYEDKVKAA
jgi:hypothetical protein